MYRVPGPQRRVELYRGILARTAAFCPVPAGLRPAPGRPSVLLATTVEELLRVPRPLTEQETEDLALRLVREHLFRNRTRTETGMPATADIAPILRKELSGKWAGLMVYREITHYPEYRLAIESVRGDNGGWIVSVTLNQGGTAGSQKLKTAANRGGKFAA